MEVEVPGKRRRREEECVGVIVMEVPGKRRR